MGDFEGSSSGEPESSVKYHPSPVSLLTPALKQVGRQCQVGSLTGAVTSQKVTEVRKGCLALVGNQCVSVKA